ncbi:prolipoprotein diacylglyceryl transferase family protein, partial [Bartonella sp. MR168JLCBS]|uniref:prolipoprotein diacylglyceryl transferase family protein n=1 Tax=Bartonella sp. MR168JLCBS TaxID=3243556 RepID=UPI0035D125B7
AFKALKRPGTVAGTFMIGYAIARSISEVYRAPQEDPEWFSTLFHSTGFTYGMALSLPMLFFGIYLLLQAFKHKSTENGDPKRKN